MKNIIFIAPPAAGKGTISDYLVKKYHYLHISTGDLLREEVKSGSEFGQELDQILKSGALVSDDVVIKLVYQKLSAVHQAFILDGFPRTLAQAEKLDQMFQELNIYGNIAVYLKADLDLVLRRVLGRVVCPNCKRSYNIYNEKLKPIVDHLCDDCGSTLIHRSDDNEETFKVRYQTFMENTKPILDFYKDKGVLKEIDASTDLEKTYQILEALAQVGDGCSND